MESGDSPPSKKKRLMSKNDLEYLSKEELIEQYLSLINKNVDASDSSKNSETWNSSELTCLRESEGKLKQQQIEATRRENALVMRLTTKEQEMQDYVNQIQELKQSQMPSATQLRSSLTDPAVNLLFEGLKKELESTKAKLEETQNELSAWKFTPDSNTGKRLMAKCRLLYQENEELGKMISSGKMAKLEGDLALQKSFCDEMRKSEADQDEYLGEVEEEVEGMQSTIVFLQKQLQEAKDQITVLEKQNKELSSLKKDADSNKLDDDLRTTSKFIDDQTDVTSQNGSICIETNDVGVEKCSLESETSKSSIVTKSSGSRNFLPNGNHDESTPKNADPSTDVCSRTDISKASVDADQNSESSDALEIDMGSGNTPNGEGNSSSDFRTKDSSHNVDSDTEVQVAQTLVSWANCENDSEMPSIKTKKFSSLSADQDAVA